jgi:predicted CxxxxCH...CXXCH cytochrome family protein
LKRSIGFSTWLSRAAAILLVGLLAACGSSSRTDESFGHNSGTSGIAVDPYIVGAQFEVVSGDGITLLQRQSTPSDTLGRFSFSNKVTPGSVVRIKQGSKGTHAGAPYTGTIKRVVQSNDTGPLVVSPLTTLLANGLSADEILFMMDGAGLAGLLREDLTADPMAGLSDLTGEISDEMLIPLQANMAANIFMEAIGDFDFRGEAQAQTPPGLELADVVTAVKNTLNAQLYRDLSASLQGDMPAPLTLGDAIQTAARLQRTIAEHLKQELAVTEGQPTPGFMDRILSDTLAAAPELARQIMEGRLGTPGAPEGPGEDPVGGIDGTALFEQQCSDCHSVGGSGFFDLTDDGFLIAGKFAVPHMGITLTSEEKVALANFLDGHSGNNPLPDPGTPASGADLYTAECQGCHGNLQNSNLRDRSATGIEQAIAANVGGMGSIVLSTAEIQAISSALPAASSPPVPPNNPGADPGLSADGAALFNSKCASCHTLAGTSGSMDLLGDGLKVAGRFGGVHYGQTLSADEILAVAVYLDGQATPPVSNPDPDLEPGPGMPGGFGNCTACHAVKPLGPSDPAIAGAHAAHLDLPGLAGNCSLCHIEENHDWQVDLVADFDITNARPATFNANGTCSNISCHGGVQTPDWEAGRISAATECQKCHVAGTSVYTGYSSGRHDKHRAFDCASCHDTGKLAIYHFGDLTTREFEIDPADTILASMNYVENNCTITCHGKRHEPRRWR